MKYENQGTESSNHYHSKLSCTIGRQGLAINPAIDVCTFLVRKLLYQIPHKYKHMQKLADVAYSWWLKSKQLTVKTIICNESGNNKIS